MKRIIAYALFVIVFCSAAFIQSTSNTDTTITIITAILNDGTKIWGTLHEENANEFVAFDFTLGKVRIEKKDVTSEEKQMANAAVIITTINNAAYFGIIIGATPKTLIMKSSSLGRFEIQTNAISKITPSAKYVYRRVEN
ncbi:MAG: hypothetical protein IPO63_07410 [Bacteroidetes bacterium]|nr:hypothetical protein [Bacteroidota bacterium]